MILFISEYNMKVCILERGTVQQFYEVLEHYQITGLSKKNS